MSFHDPDLSAASRCILYRASVNSERIAALYEKEKNPAAAETLELRKPGKYSVKIQ